MPRGNNEAGLPCIVSYSLIALTLVRSLQQCTTLFALCELSALEGHSVLRTAHVMPSDDTFSSY